MDKKIIDGIYYERGKPKHAGVVNVDGAIYYASSDGLLVTGEKTVHREMGNGILKRGVYRFGEDGKLIEGSYIPPEKSSRRKRGKGDKRKALLSAKAKKSLLLGTACLLLLFILAEQHYGWLEPKVELQNAAAAGEQTLPDLVLPSFSEEQFLCTEPLRQFYRGEIPLQKAIAAREGAYAPLLFSYQLPAGARAVLSLDGEQYELDPERTSLAIDNLMTGKTYDYLVTVTAPRAEGEQTSTYRGTVTTAATNRFITLPGVQNTRDIGGYETSSGKRVKQGMIIRGSELDGLVQSNLFLTDKDAAAPFGFKTDLDLREREIFIGDYQSRLGEGVAHHFYGAPQYGGIFSAGAVPVLREIFTVLADPDSYPIYLHCTYGADRTGTLVYLLQGVLGVSEEDMELEYRLTGFYNAGYAENTDLNGIYGGLDSMPGATLNQKICGFLTREVGVTEAQLDSIRAILLEAP